MRSTSFRTIRTGSANRRRPIGSRQRLSGVGRSVEGDVSASNVRSMDQFRDGIKPVLAGLALGILTVLGLNKVLASLVYAVSASDPAWRASRYYSAACRLRSCTSRLRARPGSIPGLSFGQAKSVSTFHVVHDRGNPNRQSCSSITLPHVIVGWLKILVLRNSFRNFPCGSYFLQS
jgi:hypothetical protein